MIRRIGIAVVLTSTMLLGGCIAVGVPVLIIASKHRTIEGSWASADGIFTATFRDGHFTSVANSSKAVLTEGSYQKDGNTVRMSWFSSRTQRQEAAVCTFSSPNAVRCEQPGKTAWLGTP